MATKIPRSKENDYTREMAQSRRRFVQERTGAALEHVGSFSFDPGVLPGNVENFMGVAQVPIGLAGPLRINGEHAKAEGERLGACVQGGVTQLLVAGIQPGTGGGDLADPGPMSGKDRSQPFVGLPAADLDDLCDWTAGRFGGYGRRINCADGTYASSAASKSACVQSYQRATPQCTATVGDLEDCINGVVDAAPCTRLPAACVELLFCAGGL